MGDVLFSYIKIYLIQNGVIFIKQIELNPCYRETYSKILIHFSKARFDTPQLTDRYTPFRTPYTFHTLYLRAWFFAQSHYSYF